MKKPLNTFRLGKLSAALTLALCCAPLAWVQAATPAAISARSFTDMVKNLPLVPAGTHDSEVLVKVGMALNAIKRLELPEANTAINEALQLDPRSSYLHFLNGFVYHLQARQGDTQKNELALEGYQQAQRIDPSNWIAREFQALAYMDLQQFDRAKLAFSDVLLMTPESMVSIYGLMVASYLTGDARTACTMADQFQKTPADTNRGFVRSSISVYAACGSFAQADEALAHLNRMDSGGADVARVERRLAQWKTVYRDRLLPAADRNSPAAKPVLVSWTPSTSNDRGELVAQAFSLPSSIKSPAPRQAPVSAPAAPTMPSESTAAQAALPPTTSPSADSMPVPANTSADLAGNTNIEAAPSPAPQATQAEVIPSGPRMLLIDVVLLSTQELIATSKGVNLLSALTLQLGSVAGNTPAYSRVTTASSTGGGPASVSTAITRAVTIPALSYSLNIANANNSVNEVLARPTLAAIEGLPSEFFSGTNLSAGVVSTSMQGGTTIVPLDKRFGIKLAVTPSFLPQGQVQLKVDAQRTSLSSSVENPRVAYQIEIAEITANANVVMKMGDTLVLSGLSEKVTATTRDGVPGLQNMPGLQYLFSNKKTNDIQRSVLILVTPRAPVQIAETPASATDSMASRMQALRDKFGLAKGVPANVEAVMAQLQTNDLFREFRQGDVLMERWDRMHSTGERLKEALDFLYY